LSKSANPKLCLRLLIDDVIPWRKQTSSLFVFENGVKFNSWNVVSAV